LHIIGDGVYWLALYLGWAGQEAVTSSRSNEKKKRYISPVHIDDDFIYFGDRVKLVFLWVLIGMARFPLRIFLFLGLYNLLNIVGAVGQGVGMNKCCASCMMSASVGVCHLGLSG